MRSKFQHLLLCICSISLVIIAGCLVYAFLITSPNARAISTYAEHALMNLINSRLFPVSQR